MRCRISVLLDGIRVMALTYPNTLSPSQCSCSTISLHSLRQGQHHNVHRALLCHLLSALFTFEDDLIADIIPGFLPFLPSSMLLRGFHSPDRLGSPMTITCLSQPCDCCSHVPSLPVICPVTISAHNCQGLFLQY